jgi:hypothetical protein
MGIIVRQQFSCPLGIISHRAQSIPNKHTEWDEVRRGSIQISSTACPLKGESVERTKTMSKVFAFSAMIVAIGGALLTEAQASNRHAPRHPIARRDVEQAHRSYLDPGPSAIVGSEDRYYSDTARYSYRQLGPAFTNEHFDLQTDPDPLFRF